MAQRLGWSEYNSGGVLPRFHQLEWAGYVTSYVRSMIYRAILLAGDNVIATETDAIFSTVPLDLPIGNQLGEWELTEHEYIIYLQNGTYSSNLVNKYRGFDSDSIDRKTIDEWLNNGDWDKRIHGTTSRFVGAGRGLGTPNHRRWITEPRYLQPGKVGKRLHIKELCKDCHNGATAGDMMHKTMVGVPGGNSFPHSLPWINDATPGTQWQQYQDDYNWDS